MKTIRALLTRFAGLFRRKRQEAEMNDELRGHLDGLIERNIAAGMSPDAARFAALRTFGVSSKSRSGRSGEGRVEAIASGKVADGVFVW
jgi:hypothetical protein